jgi:hypothetical protein
VAEILDALEFQRLYDSRANWRRSTASMLFSSCSRSLKRKTLKPRAKCCNAPSTATS